MFVAKELSGVGAALPSKAWSDAMAMRRERCPSAGTATENSLPLLHWVHTRLSGIHTSASHLEESELVSNLFLYPSHSGILKVGVPLPISLVQGLIWLMHSEHAEPTQKGKQVII